MFSSYNKIGIYRWLLIYFLSLLDDIPEVPTNLKQFDEFQDFQAIMCGGFKKN